jgi:phosphoribosylanthranilate isomerase
MRHCYRRAYAAERPQSVKIQIYSMTSVADAVAVADASADLIGVVVARAGIMPEGVEERMAREIIEAIQPRATGVALTLATDPDEICAMVEAVRPAILHIAAAVVSPEECDEIREQIAPVKVMRTIGVKGPEAIRWADIYQQAADYILLDSYAGVGTQAGTAGKPHEWTISRRVVERSRIPVVLAGGLAPENVAEAISAVKPWGVDSFTQTDLVGQRGRKDLARVREFIASVRAAAL